MSLDDSHLLSSKGLYGCDQIHVSVDHAGLRPDLHASDRDALTHEVLLMRDSCSATHVAIGFMRRSLSISSLMTTTIAPLALMPQIVPACQKAGIGGFGFSFSRV
jgi:hypothetical protein